MFESLETREKCRVPVGCLGATLFANTDLKMCTEGVQDVSKTVSGILEAYSARETEKNRSFAISFSV